MITVAKYLMRATWRRKSLSWLMVSEVQSVVSPVHRSGSKVRHKGVAEEHCSIHGGQEAEKGRGLQRRRRACPVTHSSTTPHLPAAVHSN